MKSIQLFITMDRDFTKDWFQYDFLKLAYQLKICSFSSSCLIRKHGNPASFIIPTITSLIYGYCLFGGYFITPLDFRNLYSVLGVCKGDE